MLFGQNLGGSIFLVVSNAIFNNSLRDQLRQRVSVTGVQPDVIVGVGARSFRGLGLSASALAAVVQSYANSVDRVMYLGIATAVAAFAVSWHMGNGNILEIKKLKELTSDNNTKVKPAPMDNHAAEKGPSQMLEA